MQDREQGEQGLHPPTCIKVNTSRKRNKRQRKSNTARTANKPGPIANGYGGRLK